jgi:acyl-CoA synthetase (NDP forming)
MLPIVLAARIGAARGLRRMVFQAKATIEASGVGTAQRTSPLDALLRPRSIAVVGASAREGSFGLRLLNAITGGRYGGAVYPINPRYEEIAGRRCYPDLKTLPELVDCAAFAVSDDVIEAAFAAAADAGVRAGVLFGRGYEPPRGSGPSRVERLPQRAHGDLRQQLHGFFQFR